MAYSSNFNLDSERFGSDPRRGQAPSSSRIPHDRAEQPSSTSRRLDAQSRPASPRTTNRITVSGKEDAGYPRTSRPVSRASNRSRSSADVRSHTRSTRLGDAPAQSSRGKGREAAREGERRSGAKQERARGVPATSTRDQRMGSTSDSIVAKIFDVLKFMLLSVFKLIAFLGRSIGRGFIALWNKSKIIGGALLVVLVLVGGFLIDSALTADKIYKGVSVGDVDVAGMTQTEAANALSERYGDKLSRTSVYIFTSEDAARDTDVEQVQMQDDMLAEQVSVEEALESKVLWVESSDTLGARLPVEELAAQAYEFGRSSGILDRFSTLMHAHEIDVRLDYNPTMLSKLISDINTAIGDPAQEYSIAVENGTASLVEGHDGYEIDEATFQATLTDKLLKSEVDDPRYIPVTEYVELKVDAESAQKTVDAVNAVLEEGTSFDFGSSSTEISRETLGSWIETMPTKRNGAWYLKPELSEQKALETLTESLNLDENGGSYTVTFEVGEEGVKVNPSEEVSIPDVGQALDGLNTVLFGSFCDTGTQRISGDRFNNTIQTEQTTGPLTLDESLAYGIVTTFSTYTTEFNSSTSTLNRMYNIQKVADLINDSVVKANGGTWSFNETAGDCNAEAGFKEAGVISGDEMTQEAGGGVCQVATTVFNSVYDAGLPVNERHNHTLSSSSYPAGRDAAIAYPTLDLIWENNTSSDILLTTSYNSYSVTVDLIGENPGLEVISDVSDWEEGDPYKVKVEVDETYADNAVVKMTNGSDGKTINVTRTVKDAEGNVVDQKTFSSVYSPINELYKVGPEVDVAEIQRKYARPESTSTQSKQTSSSDDTSSP